MTTALAAVLRDRNGDFTIEEVTLEDPRSDEILVKVEASGICHSDLVLKTIVPIPCVLGHEGVGVVERIGRNVENLKPGDRVIISYAWCENCAECLAGHVYLCEKNFELSFSGARLDGSSPVSRGDEKVHAAIFQQSSFSTHVVALARSVVKVDKEIPIEVAASLTCSAFTGAGIAVNAFSLKNTHDLVVFGTGVVGLSTIMAAKALGVSPIIAVDLNSERLKLASQLGATHSVIASTADFLDQLHEVLPTGAKHILDTTGVPSVWDHALALLGQGGVFAFVTVPQPWDEYALKISPLMAKGASIRAIIQGTSRPAELIPKLLDWYRTGKFPIERLVKTYPFTEINRAFAEIASGSVVKPVLVMDA